MFLLSCLGEKKADNIPNVWHPSEKGDNITVTKSNSCDLRVEGLLFDQCMVETSSCAMNSTCNTPTCGALERYKQKCK